MSPLIDVDEVYSKEWLHLQSRRRVFKSGPAEETIECEKHERGIFPLHVRGVWGPPPRKLLNFERFYVRFKWSFMRLGPDFSRFGHDLLLEKIFLVA